MSAICKRAHQYHQVEDLEGSDIDQRERDVPAQDRVGSSVSEEANTG